MRARYARLFPDRLGHIRYEDLTWFIQFVDMPAFNVFPALKDGDFFNKRATFRPDTENVLRRVHVPIMVRSAVAALPVSYCQISPRTTFDAVCGQMPNRSAIAAYVMPESRAERMNETSDNDSFFLLLSGIHFGRKNAGIMGMFLVAFAICPHKVFDGVIGFI